MLLLQRYNHIINRVVEIGTAAVPIGLYIVTPEYKLVLIRVTVKWEENRVITTGRKTEKAYLMYF